MRRIADDEKMTEAAVDAVLDQWVKGLIGPQLREREYALLLTLNDELIEALRPKALAATNRNWVREYSAALTRRASLLALRPPRDVNGSPRKPSALPVSTGWTAPRGGLIEQRSKTVDG